MEKNWFLKMLKVKSPEELSTLKAKEGERCLVVEQGTSFEMTGGFWKYVGRGSKRAKLRREREWKRPIQKELNLKELN